MLGLTSLLAEQPAFGDGLRYVEGAKETKTGVRPGAGPVVVWEVTRTCNLQCQHCYANAGPRRFNGEMTTEEGKRFIDDLAAFRVPVLLVSGGEPLSRPDVLELMEYAVGKGIRVTLSTNGTLITPEVARELKRIGVGYVGISIDGTPDIHDRVRRRAGAFARAMRGVYHCAEAGIRVGMRFTVHKDNVRSLPFILQLLEDEPFDRACFYHLVYSGRGAAEQDVAPPVTREVVGRLIDQVEEWRLRGIDKEILTVDNHADGAYLYLRMRARDPLRAEAILRRLRMNGGNRSGMAICHVDYKGNVHPDQFTQHYTFGNVRERPFGEIWSDESHDILAGLRNRRERIHGRCRGCAFFDICGGNFRTRAEAVYGDFWASDPACYLSDEEIRNPV